MPEINYENPIATPNSSSNNEVPPPQQEALPRLRCVATMQTPEDRAAGLTALQQPLQPDECMLFIFDRPSDSSFWNRGVSYPIDVAFFDKKHRLIEVRQLGPNQENPVNCVTGHFNFVLETVVDFFAQNNIPLGITFDELIGE